MGIDASNTILTAEEEDELLYGVEMNTADSVFNQPEEQELIVSFVMAVENV